MAADLWKIHQGFTIPTFVVTLSIAPLHLVKSHPRYHNRHHVVRIFEAEDTECITVLCGRLQHVYIPHLIVWNMSANEIPWNILWPIPSLLDESNGIHSLCHKCNNPIWNTKNTVHQNRFACRKERLAHPKHESNTSSKLRLLILAQLWRSILPLDNLWPPKIEISPQQILCRSLSRGCCFRPTHMNPGAKLLYHPIMISSRTLNQYGLNLYDMFLFHASSIWLI